MPVFLGLDCGGSSCRALAIDADGSVLHQGHAGPANILSTPPHILKKNITQAIFGAPDPTHIAGCFAGLVNLPERDRAEGILREVISPSAVVRALPDYAAAFMASPPGTRICVIAGTGSVICSRTETGWAKSGARGYLLGNYGSAFRYGQDALLHYLDHPEDSSETLKETVVKAFGSDAEPDIIAKLYKHPSPAALLARLAPALSKDERAGYEYAKQSITRQTSRLARQTAQHVLKYFPNQSEIMVSVAGGLWENSQAFKGCFEHALQEALPKRSVHVVKTTRAPVQGAAILARELAR